MTVSQVSANTAANVVSSRQLNDNAYNGDIRVKNIHLIQYQTNRIELLHTT